MQTFKEIPFQNYIELRFNKKNLNELSQQQALIKYKRNAQLLAEIFTFENKKRETFKTEDCISQSQIDQFAKQIETQELENEKKLDEAKRTAKKYEELSGSIKQIKSKEQLFNIIDALKSNDLYDDSHPFFVGSSPFYLSTSEQQYFEVAKAEGMNEEGLVLFQIN